MLTLIRRAFCRRCFSWGLASDCGDHRTPVERWAEQNAKLCSPEQLVEAHIINAIAKDFDDWELVVKTDRSWSNWPEAVKSVKEKHPNIDIGWCNKLLRNRRKHRNVKTVNILWKDNHGTLSSFYVNGIEFNEVLGSNIVVAFETIKKQRQEAAAVTAKALREQQANEAKWNLAEELLGMVRNEHGALVPAKTVEA